MNKYRKLGQVSPQKALVCPSVRAVTFFLAKGGVKVGPAPRNLTDAVTKAYAQRHKACNSSA